MKTKLTKELNISTYSVDADGNIRVPMLCYYMQDIASEHADELEIGFHHLMQHNWIWVLTALRLKVIQYPQWNTRLNLSTWPTHKERFYYYRDFQFTNHEGENLAIGSTQWIVIDLNTRRPIRSELPFEHAFDYGEPVFEDKFKKIKLPDIEADNQSYQVHYLDLDINKHVNNVRYVEWIIQSLSSEYLERNQLNELQIYFLNEAQMNQHILIRNFEDNATRFHTMIREEDNKEIIRARTMWNTK